MKVGEAKFGTSKKFFKFEDGDNVYRILPALGELADKGQWSKYYKVCWGYKNSQDRMRLFQDCREVNRQTKMVEVESAAYQRVEQLKAKQKQLKEAGADKDTMAKMRNLLLRFNIEGKHHVNAVNLNGEIGLLKIGHKAKMALDALIKKLREEEGKNPLAVQNGMYINFNRTGKGTDTLYQVSVYKQKVRANVNGQEAIIEEPVYHTMDDKFIARLDQEAFELNNLYPAPTSEEIEQIVNGGPEMLDTVLDKYKKSASRSSNEGSVSTEQVEVAKSNAVVAESVSVSASLDPELESLASESFEMSDDMSSDSVSEEMSSSSSDVGGLTGLSDDEFLKKMQGM